MNEIDLMSVLPVCGIEFDVMASQIPGERVQLTTPQGPVELCRYRLSADEGRQYLWRIYTRGSYFERSARTQGEALWVVIGALGEGDCDWGELRQKLFGEEKGR